MSEGLSSTEPYQRILADLAWLDQAITGDPGVFADDFLRDVAKGLSELVMRVADGEV